MKVLKKNRIKEEFNLSKVRRSIANAASDANIILNESDLSNICKTVEDVLKADGKEETSSYEIFGVIVFKLKELDYKEVAKEYIKSGLDL
ncbi:MAG: hypothetical protein E7207_05035 [Clostridium butyricum]|nr:hypothetical protein [Clostridium butyricum]